MMKLVPPDETEPMPTAFREYLRGARGQMAVNATLGLGFVALAVGFLWNVAADPVPMGIEEDAVGTKVAAVAMGLGIAALGVAMVRFAWASWMDERSGVVIVRDVELLRAVRSTRGGQFLSFRGANGKEASVKILDAWRIGVFPQRARLVTTSHSGTPLQLELTLERLRYSVSSAPGAHRLPG